MSKYDDERKQILAGMQASNVSFATQPTSKYADERSSTVSKYDDERRAMSEPEFQMPEELSALNVLKRLVPGSFERKPKPSFGNRVLGTLEDIGQGLADFPDAFTNTASLGLTDAFGRLTGAKTREEQDARNNRIGGKIGTYAGYVAPGAAADTAASLIVRPLVKNLPRVARGAVRLGTGGALFGTAQETSEALTGANDQTLGQRALDVGLSAGVGAGLGAAGPLIKAGADIGKKAILRPVFEGASKADEVLNELGSSSYGARLKPADRQVYVNRIVPELQRRVSERMTPPLENPNELAKWLKPHLGDDVSLNEIRKMSYEDMRQLAEEAQSGMSKSQIAVDEAKKMGIDLPQLLKGEMPTIRGTGDKLPVWAPIVGIKRPGVRLPTQPAVKTLEEPSLKPRLPESPPETADDASTLIAKELQIFDPTQMKDLKGFNAYTRDVYRNLESVLGKDVAQPYLESLNKSKAANIDMQKYWVDRLKTEVVDKLGIQKDSKLSALVQKYGEKKITLEELKEQAPKDWEKVVEADSWFRKAYDDLIDIVNETRLAVYPNNPDKLVPKRSDYYRHFRELNGLEGLKNLFETPAAIDPSLAGVSDFTQPRSKFAGFMQKRGLGSYKNDAVGGFLNYIPAASYATHIDPEISNFRSLADAIEGSTGDSRNMNTTIEYLRDFANDLAGKTNPADRFPQKFIGRKPMAILNFVNNRVKANTILGNIGSVLAQTANIPVGLAYAKQYAVPGLGRAVAAAFRNDKAMAKSGFLKERFSGKMYRQFDTDWLSLRNPLGSKRFAEWLMETADRLGTNFVWSSAYEKALAQKVADPIAEADDVTRKLIAGRGVGEAPLLLKSNVGKLLLPFQLEVNNLWRVMGDFVRKKDFTGIAVLFTANWLFNRAMEEVRGSSVTFDPVQATLEALEPGLTPVERGGRVAGEVLSNLPGGQTLAGAIPEYGGHLAGIPFIPSRDKLFGDNDPTRFGTGIPAAKAIENPVYTLLPGFGGNQLRKTIGGAEALREGGSFTDSGQLKFPIDASPANIARMLAFGPNSVPEARQYYDSEARPLGNTDTANFLQADDPKAYYEMVLKRRELERIKADVKKVQQNEELSQSQKQRKMDALIKRYEEALKEGSAQ